MRGVRPALPPPSHVRCINHSGLHLSAQELGTAIITLAVCAIACAFSEILSAVGKDSSLNWWRMQIPKQCDIDLFLHLNVS